MRDPLLIHVKKFLEERLKTAGPLLLGYSGGPDSKALLHLVLECRRFISFELILAHVDHGWRDESRDEAAQIQKEADVLGLKLYIKTLQPQDFASGNLEDQGRVHRLNFFSEVYGENNCQALLLGHHGDDQAEVVLKRVFEGASLYTMGGLSRESYLQGMHIWRPFLSISKKDVLEWLAAKNIPYFEDPTNRSDQFLRGRMREEMLPYLAKIFGKEVSANLCRLGEESQEIKKYFTALNRPILGALEGGRLDLKPFLPLPELQLKYLLKEWMQREGVTFSRDIIEGVCLAITDGKRKLFYSKEGQFQIENNLISFIRL